MWLDVGWFLGGLALLLVGGRLLVAASVDAARRWRVSPLVVGLTLVAWGTSAPELALNLASAANGRGDMALGNVVGANICNLALVLGACAIVRPLVVQERLIAVEIWLCAAMLLGLSIVGLTDGVQRWEPAIALFAFGLYSMWTIMAALKKGERIADVEEARILGEDPTHAGPPMGWYLIGASFLGGLALLGFGGSIASGGASAIAVGLGVPPAIVGVTIVSIGTTLPELVTGLLAVRKGQTDLAMGNAIGSCLFNAGAIFGVAALISPPRIDGSLVPSFVFLGVLGVALVPISRTFGKQVSRAEGIALLASYAAFLAYSAIAAAGPG